MIGNGHYEVQHKVLGTKYRLKAHNGSLRLFDINSDLFIRHINEMYLREWYNIGNKLPSEPKLYNISWVVNGSIKEVIQMKASYAVCVHKIAELQRTSHKSGKLIISLCE